MNQPVYKDPEHEWLWQEMCTITNKKYRVRALAYAWMVGFLIGVIVDLMRNDSAVRVHVKNKLKHFRQKNHSIQNQQ